MFVGFEVKRLNTSNATIKTLVGGSGPPLLLLHGYPQTHVMWHRMVPCLAKTHTVVATDLRGYGDSSKPAGGYDHVNYSKRQLALDQVEVMRTLGFSTFSVVGHDRGGRVGHRMALDHPDKVEKLAVLDICPTRRMYEKLTKHFATVYYHWFFLIQRHDVPERLIGADPEYFLRSHMGRRKGGLGVFSEKAMAEYVRCFIDPMTIHATCEEYRASATIDLVHDKDDSDKSIQCPLLAIWGQDGLITKCFDPITDWNRVADDVHALSLPGGHYLPEECPALVNKALLEFLNS